jgi:hypothetical protein
MTGRIAFAGPSLGRASRDSLKSLAEKIEMAPSARFGDIAQAVQNGFAVVVLIDGVFGEIAPPRHKEILYALAGGVTVIGAASLGALRACECAAFGMIGIGEIFEAYRDGRLVADDAVATLHGPLELGHISLTDPLVTIDANLRQLQGLSLISDHEAEEIRKRACETHFSRRQARPLILDAIAGDPARAARVKDVLQASWVDPKENDALQAIRFAVDIPAVRSVPPTGWVLADTYYALEYAG